MIDNYIMYRYVILLFIFLSYINRSSAQLGELGIHQNILTIDLLIVNNYIYIF